MSPDRNRPSMIERLAAKEQSRRSSAVARTRKPFSRLQKGFFLACMAAAAALAWGGWNYLSVSRAIGRLKDPDAAVRRKAAQELGQFKSSRALAPLLDAMKNDTEDHYEAEAAGSLGIAALAPLLADLKDNTLTSAAADGLVKIGALAVEPLLAGLSDADSSVRWGAARALGGIGDPRAVDALIARLADKEDNVREQAAQSLGQIKDPRADQPLIGAFKDSDVAVRHAAGTALGKIADPQAVSFLLAALRDQDAPTLVSAVDFYIRRGDPGSEDALIAALQQAGGQWTAEEMLNSGNQKLHDAAQQWASENDFEVTYLPGGEAVRWGDKQ